VVALVLALADRGQIGEAFRHANAWLLIPALAAAAVSYLCLSLEVAIVFRAFGVGAPFGLLLRAGFISYAISYLLNVGGIAGLPVQLSILRTKVPRAEDVIGPSLFQLYLGSLPLFLLLALTLANLVLRHAVKTGTAAYVSVSAILLVLLALAGIGLLRPGARRILLKFFAWLGEKAHLKGWQQGLDQFDGSVARGASALRRHTGIIAFLLALTLVDWSVTLAALWLCFRSLGIALAVPDLITGFSLGIAAGFVSFIPGGLGVQEASMAGVFALLGVPLSVGVLGAALFRVVYYFIPFAASLPFYRRLLSAGQQR
jgi:glycosyltransferase 2 family protein